MFQPPASYYQDGIRCPNKACVVHFMLFLHLLISLQPCLLVDPLLALLLLSLSSLPTAASLPHVSIVLNKHAFLCVYCL